MDRSYLFAPGHNAKLLDRVFRAGRARLPLRYVGRIAPLDTAQSRDARGRLADSGENGLDQPRHRPAAGQIRSPAAA